MSAIGSEIITRLTGYDLDPQDFQEIGENVPVQVGILAEGNTANQAGMVADVPIQIKSVAQAAAIGGWGSPIYQIAKILFPASGNLLGAIPVFVYPQLEAAGAAAKVYTVTGVGNAVRNGTHFIKICGRKSVGGRVYAINIIAGDTPTIVHGKIADAIANVLGAPVSAVGAVGQCTITSKWKGLSANNITVSMDTNGDDLGITYTTTAGAAGSGTPSVSNALALFGNRWITHVINSYGLVSTVMDALEAFNGHPKSERGPATGRWSPTVFKPIIAVFSGSVSADPSATTDTRLNELTIKVSPAPNSPGLPMEAAANDCLLHAVCAQNTPHGDVTGQAYPDMPVPDDGNIGVMADWSERDRILKKGCATVNFVGGVYVIEDPVTTYHPVGESIPAFRFVRTIVIDTNVYYTISLKEGIFVKDKTLVADKDKVSAQNIVKPKMWKAELAAIASSLVDRGLTVDADFMIEKTKVGLSTTNPDKLSTVVEYKRSGYARQSETTAKGGFNFGTITIN